MSLFFTQIKLATLDEYFSAVEKDINEGNFVPSVFSGDFFTYSDMNDDYWSGYFTSRMFTKIMERELLTLIR